MGTKLNPSLVDPKYIQVNRTQAAEILCVSERELDRRRKTDPRCPVGFKIRDDAKAPVRFRLSDIYTYSEAIMMESTQATG